MLADCGFNCVSNGQDYSRTCDEIMLFGVRVRVEPMRKSVSLNNLSQYEHLNNATTTTDNDESVKAAVDDGYASADDAVPHRPSGGRERKRGVPWTEEEHKVFLLGLQKVGKGNWRGISRNYVKSRTPTQVASHAQKYFLRRTNLNRRLRRRRSSLFDITTDSDSVSPTSPEERKVSQDNLNLVPSPVTVAPPQIEKPMENMVFALGDEVSEPSSLSLKLSMSLDQSHLLFQGMSSFINGDTVVSVA